MDIDTLKRPALRITGPVLFCVFFTDLALADTDSALVTELGLGFADFNYQEFDANGQWLDEEDGRIPQLLGQLSWSGHPWSWTLKYQYQKGVSDYRAELAGSIVSSQSDEVVHRLGILAEYEIYATDMGSVQLGLGAGYRHWQRTIRSSSQALGLDEGYRWPYLQFQLAYQYQLTPLHQLYLSAAALKMQQADIEVAFAGQAYDDIRFDLPDGDGFELEGRWLYQINSSLQLVASLAFTQWDVPRSQTETLRQQGESVMVQVTEPESKTRVTRLQVGLRKTWN